ncbi:MAG: response regulator transcription factor [Lachnospiraceae bacterium]|nr:response regulator transcription factor [Lachnospiraceae bacterium]
MAHQILLVDDTSEGRELIWNYFMKKGNGEIRIDLAEDGKMGMEKIYEKDYDLVLLNMVLPKYSGFQICRELRKRSDCPVIFLTTPDSKENILYGYELGADDCVIKPFMVEELFAKSKALLRRSGKMAYSDTLVCGRISLDTCSMIVCVDGQEVELPTKEYLLLKSFMERPDQVFSREQLLLKIWGYDYEGNERVIDNHIKNLRKSLGMAGAQIHTVIGRGYRLTGQDV